MMVRLTSRSLAGITRTLVAVGTSREACMLVTMRPAAPLRGAAGRIVTNMQASLEVPTATSVRVIPAKLLEVNRTIINNQLFRTTGGKVSFTHLIGYAVVKSLVAVGTSR